MARLIRIAACQYQPTWQASFSAYEDKISALVAEAVRQGGQLLVFPEYGLMELASIDGAAAAADLALSLKSAADHNGAAQQLFARLARSHKLHILAPSGPVRMANGTFRNRAHLHGATGHPGHQDKLIMTRFEREQWHITGGTELTLFETAFGKLGILICYDAEFPLPAHALMEAGAEVLLVPSCTDTPAGAARVRIGAAARALEGQCLVVTAPLVGAAPWCPAIDVNAGAAGIFAPPDRGFPDSGVIAEGAMNVPGWVIGDVDLDEVARVREAGQVLNYRHWGEQVGGAAVRVVGVG